MAAVLPALDVKWNLFGRRKLLLVSLPMAVLVLAALVLAYSRPSGLGCKARIVIVDSPDNPVRADAFYLHKLLCRRLP